MTALPIGGFEHRKPTFLHSGVEYFGPLDVTTFRRKVKRWGCLYICLTMRAVHLEMAYSLGTDSFLSTLLRFE